STLIGDSAAGGTFGAGIAVDAAGGLYVAGNSGKGGALATTPGVIEPAFGGTNQCCSGDVGDGFVAKILLVLPKPPTSLTVSPTAAATGAAVTFTATVHTASGVATGSVDFMDGGTKLGSATLDASGVATFTTSALAAGSHSVTAVYDGDSGDAGSTSGAVGLVVGAAATPAFSVGLSQTAGSTSSGGSVSTTVSIGALGGFAGNVSFSCSGLPAHSSCSFSPATVAAGGAAAATTTMTIDTGAAGAARFAGSPFFLFPIVPLPARRRRRRGRAAFAALLAAGIVLAGCSNTGADSAMGTTPAGSYTVTVTATSGSQSHTASYSLTVS